LTIQVLIAKAHLSEIQGFTLAGKSGITWGRQPYPL